MDRSSPQQTSRTLSRSARCGYIILWGIVACVCASVGAATARAAHRDPTACDRAGGRTLSQSQVVRVQPSGSLRAAVDAAPEGTTFCLQAGVYRLSQSVVPKSGDRIVGTKGTVVSGAVLLRSFTRSGNAYVASGLSGFNPNQTG